VSECLSEPAAASSFVRCTIQESGLAWPNNYKVLREALGKNFVVDDETMACLNCTLAAIALGLQAVKNIFPSVQASRIKTFVFLEINDQQAVEEVKQYEIAYQQESDDPLGAVTGRLLHRWLGKNIWKLEAEVVGKKTGFVDVWAMSVALGVLVPVATNQLPAPLVRTSNRNDGTNS
jgi:hypothetical protein